MSFEYWLVQLLNRYWRPKPPKPRGRDLVVGTTTAFEREERVILREEARPMHLAVMGLSGVGKSYFLENLIRQDVNQGTGFVVFDVHGDLAENVLGYLAERAGKEREMLDRIVLIEPFDEAHTIGFNPLERTTHTSAFLQAQELAHILHSRWGERRFGARTEELLRSALYTLSARDLTLVEMPRLLTDKAFRRGVVRGIGEGAVVDYWEGRFEGLSERMQAAVREPLLTRVSAFLGDPQIREIVGQRKSTF
ncbi:MAG: helicase HerA domain-containing protein, partial [Acidobacteriota bacterium]